MRKKIVITEYDWAQDHRISAQVCRKEAQVLLDKANMFEEMAKKIEMEDNERNR